MNKIIVILMLGAFGLPVHAASRYYYDIQKFEAILKSAEVQAKLEGSTLDGITLLKVNQGQQRVTYSLKTGDGKCSMPVTLSWDQGLNPNYRVVSIGQTNCI